MSIKFWPSGHSDDYSTILVFKDKKEAVEKRKELAKRMRPLGAHANGYPVVYRIQNAIFMDYELNQDQDAMDEQQEFGIWLREQLDAKVTDLLTPRTRMRASEQIYLRFTLPTKAELVLLNSEQISLVKDAMKHADRENDSLGTQVSVACGFPDGKEMMVWFDSNFKQHPIKLLKSTFKDITLVTPAGEFSLGKTCRTPGERVRE